MMLSALRKTVPQPAPAAARPANASRALEWLWKYFQDVSHPSVLDCGPVSQSTLDVLVRRGAKVYVSDLLTPAWRGDQEFWDRSGKHPVFRRDHFLSQLPNIPPNSLSAIFCWHLLDLLPHDALPGIVERFCSYLQTGGVLFCVLREPFLELGAEANWWLESLLVLGSNGKGRERFAHPVLTNREMERLAPACTLKTFLTRSGRREVIALK
jgi:hypothetical protein